MRNVMVAGWVVVFAACGAVPQQKCDAGVPTNHPPRIIDTGPRQVRSTWYATTLCSSLNPRFALGVKDEDGDSLRSLWFIDIDQLTSAPFISSPTASGLVTQLLEEPAGVSFSSALANLPTGVHLLTVYVADSDFNEVVDQVVSVSRPDGFIDRFTWVLDVAPCP